MRKLTDIHFEYAEIVQHICLIYPGSLFGLRTDDSIFYEALFYRSEGEYYCE